ncbi:MAG: hypothetical protein ACXW20_15270 [Burkholderiales bacterium]
MESPEIPGRFSPAGKRVYVSNGRGASVSVIDTATDRIIDDSGRAAPVEHGGDTRWAQALRRQRPAGFRRRDSTP